VEESSRKEHEYNKSANEYRNRYEKECAAMGIPGHDVKTELRGLVSELPKLLDEVAALLQSSDTVEKAYQYYRAFVHYTASVPSGARITFYCFLYFIFIYLTYLTLFIYLNLYNLYYYLNCLLMSSFFFTSGGEGHRGHRRVPNAHARLQERQ
jgi:hypothetical protein